MKLESQVCSLKLANRLRELGVLQESYFYWATPAIGTVAKLEPKHVKSKSAQWAKWPSAFSVGELGEMLPEEYITRKNPEGGGWQAWELEEGLYDKSGGHILGKTEADARAKVVIYLIENKIVSVDEINARLTNEN